MLTGVFECVVENLNLIIIVGKRGEGNERGKGSYKNEEESRKRWVVINRKREK